MIHKAVHLLVNQLNQVIPPLAGGDEVVLGNIALNEGENQTLIQDKVVLSLVNIEEESTMKNGRNHTQFGGAVQYFQRPVHLNLYILFTANYSDPARYYTALEHLSKVIGFFQNRKTFNLNNAQPLPDRLDIDDPDDQELHLSMELYTMTFEQINHLWGSLGGKQIPFVMYKARLVKIHEHAQSGTGTLIEEVQNNTTSDMNDC